MYAKNYIRIFQVLEILMKREIVCPLFENRELKFILEKGWLPKGEEQSKAEPKKQFLPYLKSVVKFLHENERKGITKEVLLKKFEKARDYDIEKVITFLIEKKAFVQISNSSFRIEQTVIDFIYKETWGDKNKK
jgi:hypothetical protein